MLDDQVTTGSAEPAAGAPDSAAGAAVAAPPAPSGTQGAIESARQRLAEQGTILPAAEDGDRGADQGETEEQKTAREAAEAAGAETPEQKAAREADEAAAAAAGEHTGETDEEKAAREAAEAADAEAAEHPELIVTLPPLEERGEKPIEITAPDQETAQRLNRLNNEAALGRAVKQERRAIERQYEQLEQVEDQIAVDPAGFVLERVAEPVRADVAMHLLFDPTVLEQVQQRLADSGVEGGLAGILENPDSLRVLRAELKAGRLEMREQLRGQADQRREMSRSAQAVAAQIEQMIPESIVGEQRETLYREAVQDMSERCRRLGIQKLAPEDVALLVGDRFRKAGIVPASVPSAPANGRPAAKPPAPVGRTAEQFRQDQDRRNRAAAAAPAGAGAPAAKPRPALPPTTVERITLARKVGLRALLGKR